MKLDGKKVMVTGAAGFIGSHVAERLADRCELVLLDDFSIGPRSNLANLEKKSGIRIVESDICNREAMLDAMEGVDVVIHMAISCLRMSLGAPELSHDINAGGTLSVLMAAQRREVIGHVTFGWVDDDGSLTCHEVACHQGPRRHIA